MSGSRFVAVAGAALLVPLLGITAVIAVIASDDPFEGLPGSACVVTVDGGGRVQLDSEQQANAEIIIATAVQIEVPDIGIVIALATALVESQLRNLSSGDLDSLGLFQQRPSAGWGTPEQITDPQLATLAFFGVAEHTTNPGLLDLPGWEQMDPGAAAQAVQISAFADRYGEQLGAAGAIFSALTGGENPCAGSGDLVQVPTGSGATITVSSAISEPLAGLLAAATADGVTLDGWGWRSTQRQIELRTTNGCPDVWTSPASDCRVPTAIPGRSLHEVGLAIDFTCAGATVQRGTTCDTWLLAHAPAYGLHNLATEAWHYSLTGG